MITQVKDFISTILDSVRLTTFVTGKVPGTWKSGAPFYFHGTPLELNIILGNIPQGQDKFPAVFLLEPFSEIENNDRMENVGNTATLSIMFLSDWSGKEEWSTDEHYTNIINDMDALKREFIKELNKNKYVGDITYTTTRHARWGLFLANKGNKNPVFDEELSGVELNITIPIEKLIDGCDLFDEYNF